jgi:methyl-accepting chemotaxis protein
MIRNVRLAVKLLAAFLFVGIAPVLVIGAISLKNATDSLSKQALEGLKAASALKKLEIEGLFKNAEKGMDALGETVAVLRKAAMDKMTVAQVIKRNALEAYFSERTKNVLVLSKDALVLEAMVKFSSAYKADEGKMGGMYYSLADIKYGDSLRHFQKQYGFEDIYLITSEGIVVFSTSKGPDQGENLTTGGLKESALAACFREASSGLVFKDFESYAPFKGAQFAFFGVPLVQVGPRGEKESVGVAVLRIGPAEINAIMARREGMGRSGETFLVGQGKGKLLMRSDLKTIGDGKLVVGAEGGVLSSLLEGAFERPVREARMDDSGKMVLVIADPMEISGVKWALITKMDLEEAIVPGAEEGDFFSRYIKAYGYEDLLLIHPLGKVFYSVKKKADYGGDVFKGPLAGTILGKAAGLAVKGGKKVFSDIAPYGPANGEPAYFCVTPILFEGKTDLLVALHMGLGDINRVMQSREAMGETGETYIVGSDGTMRSDSILDKANRSVKASFADPSKGRVETEAVKDALAGKEGAKVMRDFRGVKVLSAYSPVSAGGNLWAMVAQIDEDEAFSPVKGLTWILGLVAFIGVLCVIGIALFVTRQITMPLKRIMDGLASSSQEVADASAQVSSSSHALAEGASEQAASLEETSASLEQISGMTRQNANNAGAARTAMEEAKGIVERVAGLMKQMAESMEEIKGSSSESGKIIKTIDEIAFQTNLLALNAAVEAARAGEAGAGFAVVADEVRNLAIRAAEAAKNTASLIEHTIKAVETGGGIAASTSEAFRENIQIVSKVASLVEEIAAASTEQAQGIEQLNKAVSEMDRVVQQVAASAEQSASASEQMKAQAEEMKAMVMELAALVGAAAEGESGRFVPEGAKAISGIRAVALKGDSKVATGGLEISPRTVLDKDSGEL